MIKISDLPENIKENIRKNWPRIQEEMEHEEYLKEVEATPLGQYVKNTNRRVAHRFNPYTNAKLNPRGRYRWVENQLAVLVEIGKEEERRKEIARLLENRLNYLGRK